MTAIDNAIRLPVSGKGAVSHLFPLELHPLH